MKPTLGQEKQIIRLAQALELDGQDPAEAIMNFCRDRVRKVLKKHKKISTVSELEKALCSDLNLVIHEVRSDQELKDLKFRYAQDENDPAFGSLEMHLEKDSYGVIFEKRTPTPSGELQYVAFIDCRGEKAARSFFTKWHEIAHRLTSYPQSIFPVRRNILNRKDPIERLIDQIAGDMAFLDELFQPIFKKWLGPNRNVTFQLIDDVKRDYCSEASFESLVQACMRSVPIPIVAIEAEMSLKATEMREITISKPAGSAIKPIRHLRVVKSFSNKESRRSHFFIPKFIRVPEESIITKAFNLTSYSEIPIESFENMSSWKFSGGGNLEGREVLVQVRKNRSGVFAILSNESSAT